MTGAARTGVVVMAYGTPATTGDIAAYYTHIRRGRPPTEEQLAELTARYDAIGGISPLAARTRAQIEAIAAASPDGTVFELGQKHAAPFIEDGVSALVAAGVDQIVGIVLAPHYSGFSVGQYHQRAAAVAAEAAVTYSPLDHWHLLEEFVDHQARALRTQLAALPHRTRVVFTAHSLPERVLADDPYPDELAQSAAAIAAAAGLADSAWMLGWQSAGRTPEPWRGPDILDVLASCAEDDLVDAVLVVPQGFTSDHLEVVYDLDIEAAGRAASLGLGFARTAVVNDDSTVMSALARRIVEIGR